MFASSLLTWSPWESSLAHTRCPRSKSFLLPYASPGAACPTFFWSFWYIFLLKWKGDAGGLSPAFRNLPLLQAWDKQWQLKPLRFPKWALSALKDILWAFFFLWWQETGFRGLFQFFILKSKDYNLSISFTQGAWCSVLKRSTKSVLTRDFSLGITWGGNGTGVNVRHILRHWQDETSSSHRALGGTPTGQIWT